jgi:DNA polymerase-3 subunit delta
LTASRPTGYDQAEPVYRAAGAPENPAEADPRDHKPAPRSEPFAGRRFASELQKIQIYAGNATVDEAVIESLAPVNHESNIFQFVDAVAEGRTTQAMQSLAALRNDGETPQRILNMIARQIRMITVARELLDRGGSEDDIRQALGAHPFVAKRAANQARRYTQATADAALRRVLDADLAIQNYRHDRPGAMRDDQALELLVADLVGPARRPAASR